MNHQHPSPLYQIKNEKYFSIIEYVCPMILAYLDLVFILLSTKLGELKLGELLDTPPPGLDEAIAISKVCTICFVHFAASTACSLSVDFFCLLTDCRASWQVMQFLESQEYSMFTRIVFDTAPTVSKRTIVCVPEF